MAGWLRRIFWLILFGESVQFNLLTQSGADVTLAVSASVPNRMTITLKCIIIYTDWTGAGSGWTRGWTCGTSRMLSDTAGDTPSRPSLENLGSLSSTENIVIKLLPVFQLPVLSDTTGQWRLGLPVCMKSTIPIDISAPRNREFDHVISNPNTNMHWTPKLTRLSMQTVL